MISTPRLDVNIRHAQMYINKTESKVSISGQNNKMVMDKIPHHFSITKKDAEIDISNYPAYKQLDMKNISDLQAEFSAKSQQAGFQAVAEISSDGDALMKIEQKGAQPISGISKRKFDSNSPPISLNVTYFPKEDIRIKVREGYMNVQDIPEKLRVESVGELDIRANFGSVDVEATYPEISINFVGGNIDLMA